MLAGGLPLIMTRVWPIAMVQFPTAIYMIAGFENKIRIIYLDGREHTPSDEVVRTFGGESIGRWEGGELVVDTSISPVTTTGWTRGERRCRRRGPAHRRTVPMIKPGVLEIEYTMTDPKNWVGEWKMTETFRRREEADISEVQCLPDLNEHLPATRSKALVK